MQSCRELEMGGGRDIPALRRAQAFAFRRSKVDLGRAYSQFILRQEYWSSHIGSEGSNGSNGSNGSKGGRYNMHTSLMLNL